MCPKRGAWMCANTKRNSETILFLSDQFLLVAQVAQGRN